MAVASASGLAQGERKRGRPLYPTEEQEIIDAFLFRRDQGTRLKPVGSRGSKNGCFRTSGVPVRLDNYDRILSVGSGSITTQAGVTVGKLNAFLQRQGLALPTHGEWTGATVAGAAATGTHGGSLQHGIFSSSILSVRIISADGTVREFGRDSACFQHVGVSLGVLGIISTITFDCEENFCLEMRMGVSDFESFLCDHGGLLKNNEFFSAVWSPSAQRVLTFAANRVPKRPASGRRRERFCLRHCLHHRLSRLPAFDAFPLGWSGLSVVGDCYDILSPIHARGGRIRLLRFLGRFVKAAEFSVPLRRAEESMALLDELLRLHPRALAHPIGVRATAGDNFSMSPAFGRDSLWIDLFFVPDQRFEASLQELFESMGARCHWGKYLALSRDHLLRHYPEWDAFWGTRSEMDPGRMLANDFTQSLEA